MKSIIAQIIMMVVLINVVSSVEDFGKIKEGFILLILTVSFNGILDLFFGKRSVDDERKTKRWKGNVSRFKGKLVE